MKISLQILNLFSQKNILILFLHLSFLFKKISSNIITIENAMFPITLSLSNDNIFFVSNSSITFYNSFFNSTIKTYKLNKNESIQTKEESYKTVIGQYPNGDILLLIKDHLKIYSQDGDKIIEKDLSEIYNIIRIYNLIPIKIENNYFYYIIAFTNSSNFTISLIYYKIDKEGNNFTEIFCKKYNLTNFIKNNEHADYISNINCELMRNISYPNQLVCFYISRFPSRIHATAFDIENELKPINNVIYYDDIQINEIKSICNENKLQALICFFIYKSSGYCSIYDLNNNIITEPQKYISNIGSSITDLQIYYFKKTHQYILFTRGDDNTFRLIKFNNNFEIISKEEIIINLEIYLSFRDSIIYLPQYKKYSIISDGHFNGLRMIRLYETNFTSEIFNNNENEVINIISNNTNIFYSNERFLNEECNKSNGFYPVYYNYKNELVNQYQECFNNETKPINFYFNKEKEAYEPCYETCRTCNYKGNSTINNCTSCDFDSIFRPEQNTTNCVKKCRHRYYITPYGQYKCTKDKECNDIANLYIREKDKCTNNCSLDDTYYYQFNGECVNKCPPDTKLENNSVCVIINKEACSIELNEYNIENNLTNENLELIAKTYANEYKYTNNHISLFKHQLYLITLYKNKQCINELGLSIPQIDFGNCIEYVKKKYNITDDLLVLIIERYSDGKSIILYSLYDPITGYKLDTTNLCDKETIKIEENVIATLNTTDINLNNLLKLTEQNIDLFNKSSSFYNDICFHFESPNGKDITLRDRILDYYPNITLCNEGCFYEGVNLTSMMALCQCKFTELLSGKIFSGNAFMSKISDDIIEIISMSNLEILKCYKDIFSYEYFIKNIGGFIALGIIFSQSICVIFFIFISMNNMRKYSFGLIEIYLRYINPRYSMKYSEYIPQVIKDNPPIKNKENKENDKNKKLKIFSSSKNLKNIQIAHENENSESKYLSLFSQLPFKNNKNKTKTLNKNGIKRKMANSLTVRGKTFKSKSNLDIKIKKYMKEYLSTDEDDMEYDDAIKKDNRKFFSFFWERVKVNTWIVNIIFSEEKLKPRSIRILLFLLNVDLYFTINGIYFNEDYVSEVYHSDKEEKFFDFVSRTNYNFFYASMVGAIVEYMINCFFVEEKKFQNLFRREKDNELRLRSEFGLILNLIKSRYIAFFVISYVITIFSWYYITCFNNIYPNMKIEWIKSSISIIIIMIFVYIGLALLETILRFLSFKCKSEKIFKFSKIFADCC